MFEQRAGRTGVQIITALLLSVSLSGCQLWELASFQWQNADAQVGWTAPSSQQPLREGLPFTLYNNHIIVQARVNGSAPLNFVLDSGAAATVLLETDATDALALPRTQTLTISGAGDDGDPVAYVVPDTRIDAGPLFIRNMAVIYAPQEAMPFGSRDETYFDGVLGADFFNCCVVEINHDEQRVYLQPRGAETLQRYQQAGWQKLDMEVEGDTPYLTTSVDDGSGTKTVKVMLDTGSTGTLTLFAGQGGQISVPPNTYAARSSGISGDSQNQVGWLPRLHIGEQQFDSLPIYFRTSGSNPQSGSDGVLGNRVLKRFNQVFDFSAATLWLQPTGMLQTPATADRSGLRLLPHRQGAIVKDIAASASEEARGIPLDSVVTHIDDKRVTRDTFDPLLSRLRDTARDAVKLCWSAATEQRCARVPLFDRI
ncbi:aspartyl protease family protein [Aestuariibacter halophilus]|uniref:Aspartyl protease family protein n=1 Tax=Fluctibacter halophilus TaxID=226011 RepID=A0ABS8GDT0_9ALTE|nr:aspartyl protease family protein [Aestuariibacter halophilus]MCC2617356.1 aspartyl protease family protein [Aestuariibacter halophilus]